MKNRRVATRNPLLTGARLRIGNTEQEALVHDINETGCRLTVASNIEVGLSLQLAIGIPELSEPVGVSAVTEWVESIPLTGSFEVGVKFVEFDKPQHFQHLSVMLEKQRRKQASLEPVQYPTSKLVQIDKMEALGTLTASLAHELSSPLTVISGITEFLKLEPVDQSMVDDLSVAAKRCIDLVREITNWSRQEDSPVESASLDEVIGTTLRLVRPGLMRSNVRLEVELHEPLPTVRGHAGQLSQVLVNLINNSRQALAGQKDGIISVEGCTTDREVYLYVNDNGPGIPPENLARIFDPFFTTKPKGEGTGLGLSISRDILRRYGGRLEVRNLPVGGVQFQMCLPFAGLSHSAPRAEIRSA